MNDKPAEEPITLAVAEQIIGVPADEIRMWIVRGVRLPGRRLFRMKATRSRGGHWLVTETGLREFVAEAARRRTLPPEPVPHPRQWPSEQQELARSLVGRVKQPA